MDNTAELTCSKAAVQVPADSAGTFLKFNIFSLLCIEMKNHKLDSVPNKWL
jgi:hypothetical protein